MPPQVEFNLYEGLGSLPHFDDSNELPGEVKHFRELVTKANGIIICTPEYAFGVPGSLKNALDWTVSSGEFVNKPVALITAASVGRNAHASLLLTLSAISAKVTETTSLLIPFIRSKLDETGNIKDNDTLHAVQTLVNEFVEILRREDPF